MLMRILLLNVISFIDFIVKLLLKLLCFALDCAQKRVRGDKHLAFLDLLRLTLFKETTEKN